jgi:hypothetical protein
MINIVEVQAGVDPESGNCRSSHFKRLFLRNETELEINTL